MIIVEYRVPMPFCAAEYRIGQLYTIAKKSKLENADPSNGVRIHANEPYSNGPGGYGQYTNKTYYMANRIPDWMKKLLPASAAELKEEAWNAYPYSKNKFTNPLLDKLNLEIESRYIDGPPTLSNVFNLNIKEESPRSIVVIDIVNDKYKGRRTTNNNNSNNNAHNSEQEAEVLNFEPLFRPPLNMNWLQESELAYGNLASSTSNQNHNNIRNHNNNNNNNGSSSSKTINCNNSQDQEMENSKMKLMTCYKLCRVNFPVWPIQSRVEQFIQQYCRDTMLESHRQAWLWQDEWTGMSLEQIRSLEKNTQGELLGKMREASLT